MEFSLGWNELLGWFVALPRSQKAYNDPLKTFGFRFDGEYGGPSKQANQRPTMAWYQKDASAVRKLFASPLGERVGLTPAAEQRLLSAPLVTEPAKDVVIKYSTGLGWVITGSNTRRYEGGLKAAGFSSAPRADGTWLPLHTANAEAVRRILSSEIAPNVLLTPEAEAALAAAPIAQPGRMLVTPSPSGWTLVGERGVISQHEPALTGSGFRLWKGEWSARDVTQLLQFLRADVAGQPAGMLVDLAPEAADAIARAEQEMIASRAFGGGSCETLAVPPGLRYYNYQCDGIDYALRREGTLFGDEMGVGKAQPLDAKVMTPTGWRTIGDLVVGDFVIGSNGQPVAVMGIYPRGVRSCFRVTMNDGGSTRCCDEHLWKVETGNDRFRNTGGRVMSLRDIIDAKLRDVNNNSRWFIPVARATRYAPSERLPVDAYLLGALIANGGLSGHGVRYSGSEDQLALIVPHLPDDVNVSSRSDPWTYCLGSGCTGKSNTLLSALRTLGIMGHLSPDKFVPRAYLVASVEDRVALLQGLMDNDGTISVNGVVVEYNTTAPRLAKDVLDLIRSLGGVAWESTRVPKYTYNGDIREGKVDHRIRMALPDGLKPFRLTRKLERFQPRTKYPPARAIVSIEPDGECQMVCIAVDAADHLYITDDFIVTHNTPQALGVVSNSPAQSVLVVCPASLKTNWQRESERWLARPFNIFVVRSTDAVIPAGANFVIVNYESLLPARRKNKATGKMDTLPSPIMAQLMVRQWDVLVVDEAHKIKRSGNEQTQQSLAVLGYVYQGAAPPDKLRPEDKPEGLAQRAGRKLFLTGTPFANRPAEVWPLVATLAPAVFAPGARGQFGGYWEFVKRYADAHKESIGYGREAWTVQGSSNLPELQDRLRAHVMVRRMKADVLSEIPSKVRSTITLDEAVAGDLLDILREKEAGVEAEISALRAVMAAARAVGDQRSYADAVARLRNVTAAVFEGMSKMRAELAVRKIPAVMEAIEDALESEERIVVMAHHKRVQDALVKGIEAKYGAGSAVLHRGGISDAKKQEAVDRFQGSPGQNPDPRVRVFVGSILASGVGITLTRSATVIFAEMDWVPANMAQAEDRCVTVDTVIETLTGPKEADAVVAGDMVMTHRGRYRKVIGAFRRNYSGGYVEIESMREVVPLKLTYDHPVYVLRDEEKEPQWRPSQDVRIGDYLCFPRPSYDRSLPDPLNLGEFTGQFLSQSGPAKSRHPIGRLQCKEFLDGTKLLDLTDDRLLEAIGWYLAEGYVRTASAGEKTPGSWKAAGWAFCHSKEEKIARRIGKNLEDIWGVPAKFYPSKRSDSLDMRFNSTVMAQFFGRSFGIGSYQKQMPRWVMNLPKDKLRIVFSAYLLGDGHARISCNSKRQSAGTVSSVLAHQVREVAAAFGYEPGMRRYKQESKNRNYIQVEWTSEAKSPERIKKHDAYVLRRVTSVSHQSVHRLKVVNFKVVEDESYVASGAVVHNCHRVGQTRPVTIRYIVIDGTLDAKLAQTLVAKQAIFDQAMTNLREGYGAYDLAPITPDGGVPVIRQPGDEDLVLPALSSRRGPQKSLEQWAIDQMRRFLAGEIVSQRNLSPSDLEFLGEALRNLDTLSGLTDEEWKRSLSLGFKIRGGRPPEASADEPVRNEPQNPIEAWAIAALVELARLDTDRAAIRNDVGFSKSDGTAGHTAVALFESGVMTDSSWKDAIRVAKRYARTQTPPPAEVAKYLAAQTRSAEKAMAGLAGVDD